MSLLLLRHGETWKMSVEWETLPWNSPHKKKKICITVNYWINKLLFNYISLISSIILGQTLRGMKTPIFPSFHSSSLQFNLILIFIYIYFFYLFSIVYLFSQKHLNAIQYNESLENETATSSFHAPVKGSPYTRYSCIGNFKMISASNFYLHI